MRPTPPALGDLQARKLRAKLDDSEYDASGWSSLIDELRGLQLTEESRALYEEILGAFPTAVRDAH